MKFSCRMRSLHRPKKNDLMFCVRDDLLLTIKSSWGIGFPVRGKLEELGIKPTRAHYLGDLDTMHCYTVVLPDTRDMALDAQFFGLRRLYNLIDEDLFAVAVKAYGIARWDTTTRYCGSCGTPMKTVTEEHAKLCPNCGLRVYPRIAPAIIVAVTKGDSILLARSTRFKNTKMYSVIAGFVEPGETLEDCIEREVMEEVGIRIKDIAYFASQPWPFPDSLMIAFTARYASGKIAIDKKEIVHAAWFRADRLPPIPPPMSVARALIDGFIQKFGS